MSWVKKNISITRAGNHLITPLLAKGCRVPQGHLWGTDYTTSTNSRLVICDERSRLWQSPIIGMTALDLVWVEDRKEMWVLGFQYMYVFSGYTQTDVRQVAFPNWIISTGRTRIGYHQGKIYVGGGATTSPYSTQIYSYDIEADTWSTVWNVAGSNVRPGSFIASPVQKFKTVNGNLYAFSGGWFGNGFATDSETQGPMIRINSSGAQLISMTNQRGPRSINDMIAWGGGILLSYVGYGGEFDGSNPPLWNMCMWHGGTTCSPFGADTRNLHVVNNDAKTGYFLRVFNGDLYAGGNIHESWNDFGLFKWTGSSWNRLLYVIGPVGFSGAIACVGEFDNKIVVGGYFRNFKTSESDPWTPCNGCVILEDGVWRNFGKGINQNSSYTGIGRLINSTWDYATPLGMRP